MSDESHPFTNTLFPLPFQLLTVQTCRNPSEGISLESRNVYTQILGLFLDIYIFVIFTICPTINLEFRVGVLSNIYFNSK
jgi:hypothetical protein